jgi:hypothetical protein
MVEEHLIECGKCAITFLFRLGFNTGNPRVGFSDTAPVPVYTVPVPGTGTYRTVFFTVFYETRGTSGTRGFITRSSPYNLAIVTHTSIDVVRTFREVFLGGVTGMASGTRRERPAYHVLSPRQCLSPLLVVPSSSPSCPPSCVCRGPRLLWPPQLCNAARGDSERGW